MRAIAKNLLANTSDEAKLNGLILVMALATLLTLSGYQPPNRDSPPPRVQQKISLKMKPQVAEQKPLEQVVVSEQIVPKRIEKDKKKEVAKPIKTPPNKAEVTVEDAEPEIIAATAVLEVPSIPATPPPVPDDDKPPLSAYSDKPYGAALVMAIKIDSEGNALDVHIEVPSFNALQDVAFALAAKKVKYTDIQPPAPPGSAIWIEKRIEYADPLKNQLP